MAVRKNVLQEDDILCELYADGSFGPNNFDGTSPKRKYKRLLVH